MSSIGRSRNKVTSPVRTRQHFKSKSLTFLRVMDKIKKYFNQFACVRRARLKIRQRNSQVKFLYTFSVKVLPPIVLQVPDWIKNFGKDGCSIFEKPPKPTPKTSNTTRSQSSNLCDFTLSFFDSQFELYASNSTSIKRE